METEQVNPIMFQKYCHVLLHTSNFYGFLKSESFLQKGKCFHGVIGPRGDHSDGLGQVHTQEPVRRENYGNKNGSGLGPSELH